MILQPQVYISLNSKTTPQNSVRKFPKNPIHQELATSPFAGWISMRGKKMAPNWDFSQLPQHLVPHLGIWWHLQRLWLASRGKFLSKSRMPVVVVSPTLENKRNGILVHPKSWWLMDGFFKDFPDFIFWCFLDVLASNVLSFQILPVVKQTTLLWKKNTKTAIPALPRKVSRTAF